METAPVMETTALAESTEVVAETTEGSVEPVWLEDNVEVADRETLSIALATDSCGAWMSEGYYYSYGSDSQRLFDRFSVTLEELW